jgi:hypothetical protein
LSATQLSACDLRSQLPAVATEFVEATPVCSATHGVSSSLIPR